MNLFLQSGIENINGGWLPTYANLSGIATKSQAALFATKISSSRDIEWAIFLPNQGLYQAVTHAVETPDHGFLLFCAI